MIQWLILILSAVSFFLLTKENKYAYPIGLAAQPFWIYSTAQNAQWGMLLLALFYAIIWGKGVYKHFIQIM